jgi:hypothetical protein
MIAPFGSPQFERFGFQKLNSSQPAEKMFHSKGTPISRLAGIAKNANREIGVPRKGAPHARTGDL